MHERFPAENSENEADVLEIEESDASKGDIHSSELPQEVSEDEFRKSFENEEEDNGDGIFENESAFEKEN